MTDKQKELESELSWDWDTDLANEKITAERLTNLLWAQEHSGNANSLGLKEKFYLEDLEYAKVHIDESEVGNG